MRVTVNELSFHVVDEGQGPAVLLLHGFPDSSVMWRHWIPLDAPDTLNKLLVEFVNGA